MLRSSFVTNIVITIACLCLSLSSLAQRPKVGLTLSGGGAKGLAHIGILEAIDSAGLKIDLITGTSMGSIIGGVYAMGYSGDSIEHIARTMDWSNLFANQPPMTEISPEEKDEFGKYILEIPFEYGKPKLASGMIVGQQLWLELARLAYPVYSVRDFDHFSIPFKCVATDIATGEALTLDTGNIVTSMRASMAIPSVFTAVRIGDKMLVDGGVVRNFPTTIAKDMGAKLIIGSNVSNGLLNADELNTPIDILTQLGFYKDADDFVGARKLANVYIHQSLKPFSAASFGSVDAIIDAGKEMGRQYYPVFKHIADSLNALYPGTGQAKPDRLPWKPDVLIEDIVVLGLKHTNEKFFKSRLNLEEGGCYTPLQIEKAVQHVFGTRFYKQITYELLETRPGHARMVINADENALTYAKVAINYNTYTDFQAILNFTQRNFVVPNSRAYVTAALGTYPRVRAEFLKYTGRKRNVGFVLGAYFENNPLTFYEDFRSLFEYKYKFVDFDVNFHYMPTEKLSLISGLKWEYVRLKPRISPFIVLDGHVQQYNAYLGLEYNTVNRVMFPSSGWNVKIEGGQVFDQKSNLTISENGQHIDPDSLGLGFDNYQRLLARISYYIPVNKKFTTVLNANLGMNFNYSESIINNYWIGGLTLNTRTQLPLVGYADAEVISSSAATAQLGFQYEMFNNFFLTPRVGGAVYDFTTNNSLEDYKFISGYGLSVGYSSRFGPLEATLMYGSGNGIVKAYVNVGFQF